MIDSSLQPNAQLPAGSLTWTVKFSEPMNTGNYLWDKIPAVGQYRGNSIGPNNFNWDSTGTVLTIAFNNLPDDRYAVSLDAYPGGFEDLHGLVIDGETLVNECRSGRSLAVNRGTESGRQLLGHDRDGRRDTNVARAAGRRPAAR